MIIKYTKNSLCFSAVLFLLFSFQVGKAQTVSVQGFITDGSSGEILEGGNVTLQEVGGDGFYGAATDRNGFYRIGGVQPGEYAFRITYLGYTPYEDTLALGNEPRLTISTSLHQGGEQLGDVVISVRGGTARQSVGRQRVRPVDLGRVPTPAGSGDLATYLQTQPGVVSAGDRGGQLFIRGGTPSQNMVLIDGMMIYQPFHILGFFSAFPQDLVSGADFHAGGFGAKYSGRVSSVIDVQMRDGHMNDYRGSASVSPFLGEVMAEGPIKEGNSSWIASARHSLIEHTGGAFLSEDQPLKFQSHYLKLSHRGEDTRCSATALHSYDRGRMDYQSADMVSWNNMVLGGRCLSLARESGALLDTRVNYSHISNTMDVGTSELFSGAHRFTIDADITQPFRGMTIGYGGYMLLKYLDYDIREVLFTPQVESETFIGGGMHMELTLPVGERVEMQPGVAVNVLPGMYPVSVEPRFGAGWQPWGREEEELSLAAGIYRQPLVGIADRRDVSSVFTAWMPSPVGESQKEAIHALLGWGQDLGGGLQWSLEGFYKRVRNQPVTTWSTNAQFTTDLTLAHGHVYGGDARLEYSGANMYGSLGYGYTWTRYQSAQEHFSTWFGEPVQSFHPPHDRRHQVNTQFSVDLGPYTAGMSWQLGTGLPYTQPYGFDDRLPFEHETLPFSPTCREINDIYCDPTRLPDVREELGIPRIIMDKPFNGRLPIYHRMDISLDRQFNLSGGLLSIKAGAINIYDHSNIFYFDIYTQSRINQLPFAPYLSFKIENR